VHSFQRKGTQRRENQVQSKDEEIEDDELFEVVVVIEAGVDLQQFSVGPLFDSAVV